VVDLVALAQAAQDGDSLGHAGLVNKHLKGGGELRKKGGRERGRWGSRGRREQTGERWIALPLGIARVQALPLPIQTHSYAASHPSTLTTTINA
jgi:hypothetical protein